MVIFIKQGHDPFHVPMIQQYLLLMLLLQLLLLLLLLLLLMELLPPQQASFCLFRGIRRGFGLFLEMGPPIVLDLIVSSSWQASCNCGPPDELYRIKFFFNQAQ